MLILVTKSSTVSTLGEAAINVTFSPRISLRKCYRYCEYSKMYVNVVSDVQCD
jgi:hypothetical protein